MDYNFSFTINNEAAELNPQNGLDSGVLGALLRDLGAAINPKDGSKFTLHKVSNHGYTPEFITDSQVRYLRFVELHHKIHDRAPEDLMPSEAKYARTLKRVLKDGMYLEPHDMESNLIVKIEPAQIDKTVESYFSITTVHGIISLTGAPSLSKGTHIYLDGLDYKIRTSYEQDIELRSYYRKDKMSFTIRQKKSVHDNRVVNATLISFKKPNPQHLLDNLKNLSQDDISSWRDIAI